MFTKVRDELRAQLEGIRSEGLFKPERVIVTPQQATVKVSDGGRGPQSLRQQLPRPRR